MEDALKHKEPTQCIRLSSASPGNHHIGRSEADHAPTIKLDQSDEVARETQIGVIEPNGAELIG